MLSAGGKFEKAEMRRESRRTGSPVHKTTSWAELGSRRLDNDLRRRKWCGIRRYTGRRSANIFLINGERGFLDESHCRECFI